MVKVKQRLSEIKDIEKIDDIDIYIKLLGFKLNNENYNIENEKEIYEYIYNKEQNKLVIKFIFRNNDLYSITTSVKGSISNIIYVGCKTIDTLKNRLIEILN